MAPSSTWPSAPIVGELQLRFLALGQAHLISPTLIALDPLRSRVSEDPGGHGRGEHVEHMAKRLAYQFQPIERTNSSKDMAGVGTLPTVGFQQTQLAEALQHQIEEQSFSIAIDQATTKFTQ